MTSTSILLILIGLFVVINAPNFVGVIKGDKTIRRNSTATVTTK